MTFWQSRFNPQLKLSQQDLLDVSEEITQAYAPQDDHEQSELVIMPVDPVTLYAYWNMKINGTDNISNKPDRQLILRVYSNPKLSEHPSSLKLSFDIKISGLKGQQKVYVPIAATAYSAVIGEINADHSFSTLVTSDIIHVPRETPVAISRLNAATPVIDSTDVDTNIEADNRHFIGQEPTPERSMNNNAQLMQRMPMFDPLFVAEINCEADIIHVQREQQKFEHSNHSVVNLQTPHLNTTAPQPEAFILKNFNNYGYDLKVYENGSNSEFANILSQQESGFYFSPKKSNTIKHNTSGLGLYL